MAHRHIEVNKCDIYKLYQEGVPPKKIGVILGCSSDTIYKYLHQLGVNICRSTNIHGRKYTVNHERFSYIATEQDAYWLGFIAADGCIRVRDHRYMLHIGVQAGDCNHLVKFLEYMESNSPIRYSKNGRYCFVCIYSIDICNSLIKLGIVPRKSLLLGVRPGISDYLVRHFYRGYIDGDGCICITKNRKMLYYPEISALGTFAFLNDFSDWLETQMPSYSKRAVRLASRHGKIFTLKATGRIAVSMIHLLYSQNKICLDRKADKAREVLNNANISL